MGRKTAITTQMFMPKEVPKYNTSLVPDIDAGRITNIPRELVGKKLPVDNYATNRFYFGGANIRLYTKV